METQQTTPPEKKSSRFWRIFNRPGDDSLVKKKKLNKKHGVTFASAFLLIGAVLVSVSFASSNTTTDIAVNGNNAPGATFMGVGAISGGGGNSRYLDDYLQPEQGQILDYLFKPNYGANLQILKLEIGSDINTSDGSEPSIESAQGTVNCNSGYEWSIAEQAVARNPKIKLYGLQWAAPGWVGSNVWTQKDINYVISWMNCARQNNLTISYLGGWNESRYNAAWYVGMRKALDDNGYKNTTQLLAADESSGGGWEVASTMTSDPALNSAVSVVGAHDTCGWPTDGYTCLATTDAKKLTQPLWESELGKLTSDVFGDLGGAARWARSINNSYIDARVTGLLQWPMVDSMPAAVLPYEDRGLITADEPWSGQYAVNQLTWATAQTTQFVPVGWNHIAGANQALGVSGSYNTYEAPDRSDWTIVAQNTGASATQQVSPQNIRVVVTGGLPTSNIYVWETNLDSSNTNDWFVQQTPIQPTSGVFTYTIPAGYIVTFTTKSTGFKGTAVNSSPPIGTESLPYVATKDASDEPNYFAAEEGAFEYTACNTGRTGSCIQQMAPQIPIIWLGSSDNSTPYGIVGDPSWQNYTVSSDVYVTGSGASAGVVGRFSNQSGTHIANYDGYGLTLTGGQGAWSLNKDSSANGKTVLRSGTLNGVTIGKWHNLSLSMQGSTITASIDGKVVATVNDNSYGSGLAGLESTWDNVQYDNFQVQ